MTYEKKNSWRKLNSGEWGVGLTSDRHQPGEVVEVTKKNGGTSKVTLGKRVAGGANNGGEWSLWTVEAQARATPPTPAPAPAPKAVPPKRRNWHPCGYPGCNPNQCDECDGEGLRGASRPLDDAPF